jgi:predicted aspartyl protease
MKPARPNFFHAAILLLVGLALPFSASLWAKSPPKGSSLDSFLQLYAYFPYPFEVDDSVRFILKGKIGKQSVRLLVDTGAAFTTIDPGSAPDAKTLGELKTTLHDSLLGEVDDPSVLLIDNLWFGPARFVHQPARAAKLEFSHEQVPFAGMLGVDFLVRNFCIIDCSGDRIYFRGAKPTPEQTEGMEKSLKSSGYLPVRLNGKRRLLAPSQVNGEASDWVVDTGSFVTFLEDGEKKRLGLRQIKQADLTGSMLGQNLSAPIIGLQRIGVGNRRLTVSMLSALALGEKTWRNIPIGLVDLNMAELQDPEFAGRNVHGFIGADFLRSYGALIDFSTMTIWFPTEHR